MIKNLNQKVVMGLLVKNNVLLFKHPFKTTKIGHISSNKTYLPNSRVLLKDM